MQLSVSSGKNGILQRATFLAFGDSTDHTTAFPLADMVVSANRWTHKIATWIWQASGTWQFDDKNKTDLPIATTTLVDAQQDYSLPATAIGIDRVEVLDSSGNYVKLRPMDQSEVDVALSEHKETDGLPSQYDIVGNSLFLYPAPSSSQVTTAAGLKIHFRREMDEYSTPASYTTADTTQPGFDEDYHEMVCLGIALDWCIANGPEDRADRLENRMSLYRLDLNNHYGDKNKDNRVAIKPKIQDYR